MIAPPRSTAERIADTRGRLARDVDAWVSTVDSDGEPRLSALSFLWTAETLLIATSRSGATGRNLLERPTVRMGIGELRDVVLVDGGVEVTVPDDATADGFAAKAGFDPRPIEGFAFFRVTPRSVQAWREENELAGRYVLRAGVWLD